MVQMKKDIFSNVIGIKWGSMDYETRERQRKKARLRREKEVRRNQMIILLVIVVVLIVLVFRVWSAARSAGSSSGSGSETVAESLEAVSTVSADSTYTESASPETVETVSYPDEYRIADYPELLQEPELPTGCEITAFTSLLNYYGFSVDKTTMASDYLPTAEYELTEGSDGRTYGPDNNAYFIGDPFGYYGYSCGTGAIVTAGNSYLATQDTELSTVDITGSTAEELYERVSSGQPVLVWVTIGMEERYATEGWYTDDGTYVEWSTNDHGAVLIGYTETTVTISDPLSGIVEYDRADFESVFAERGYKCVVLE